MLDKTCPRGGKIDRHPHWRENIQTTFCAPQPRRSATACERGCSEDAPFPAVEQQPVRLNEPFTLIAYTLSPNATDLPAAAPSGQRAIWSRAPLRPLAAEVATPFSYSVLAEITGRAWYSLYDRLGFSPPPAQTLVRYHQGRLFLNLSRFAALEAEQAGVQPPAFWVDGTLVPASQWQKPGLLGGLSLGRKQKRVTSLLGELSGEMETITQRARAWYVKTQEMRWSQAEVLQVMEEIERVSIDSMVAFLAVRYHILRHANRLLHLLASDGAGTAAPAVGALAQNLGRFANALTGVDDLVEVEIGRRLLAMGQQAAEHEQAMAWLKADQFTEWLDTLPNRALQDNVADFFTRYGHRAAGEGEIAQARWLENPRPVFHAILACARDGRPPVPPTSDERRRTELLHAAASSSKTAEQHLQAICDLLPLQSRALHAFAFILAGTRQWALVAGQEATADGRLAEAEDVFLFELEEVKEMMTGEWNVRRTDEIRTRLAERRASYERWQDGVEQAKFTVGELLIGDGDQAQEAFPLSPSPGGLPAVVGTARGPLRRWASPQPHHCGPAIVGASQLDSGWALTLPVAHGYAAAYGTPVDPLIAAARAWHIPTLTGLDNDYRDLVDGAQTTIDGGTGEIDQ